MGPGDASSIYFFFITSKYPKQTAGGLHQLPCLLISGPRVQEGHPTQNAALLAALAMSQFFRATFTRDGHKKLRHNRKWLDGFLKVQGCSTVLLTEEGTEIGSARLPDGTQLSEDSDELTCFGGSILVCVDAPCGAHELPGAAARAPTTAPAAEIGENVSAAANKLPPARPLPSTRPSGAGRKAFAAPRLSRPQQAAPTAGPSLQRPVQQQQQQQVALRAYPAPSAPTSRQPAAVAQHRLPVPAATSSAAAVSQAPQERTGAVLNLAAQAVYKVLCPAYKLLLGRR